MANNYVDGEILYDEMNDYCEAFNLYKEKKKLNDEAVRPSVSPELGKMILDIAENLAKKGNFAGYTWKDDMVQDACMACILYMHNYNKNYKPFNYITSICARAFINHIKKQKKHTKIKDILVNAPIALIMDSTKLSSINYQDIKKLYIEE
jgi:hypothetical protein